MRWWLGFYRSALGKKAVMAVTGIALFGFVFVHMLGNLKLYLGAEHFNEYAEWLREVGAPAVPHSGLLWIARIVLAVAVIAHIHAAWTLTLLNRRARPQDYTGRKTQVATYASRTMRWGGVIIVLFVLYHLAHFTWGLDWAHPDFKAGDAYHNVVAGFQVWWVSGFYIVAQAALGLHLYHGLWSMLQSLGFSQSREDLGRRRFAGAFAWVVTVANISFPVAVLTGIVS